jgi:hypothetical protein
MKIAILTSPRSGSTSLFNLIQSHLNLKSYFSVSEPFNSGWRERANLETYDFNSFDIYDNLFIKTFVADLQRPKQFKNDEEGYWKWFFDYFDKVVLLERNNKDLQSESLIYHLNKNELYSWQKKQHYNLSNIKKEEINDTKISLIEESRKIKKFSEMGYPIFYFEDIFIDKNKLKIDELFSYLGLELNNDLYEKFIISDMFRIRLRDGEPKFRSII